jgi:hypothetical protein
MIMVLGQRQFLMFAHGVHMIVPEMKAISKNQNQ